MKKYLLLFFLISFCFLACNKDPHYSPPSSSFTGSLLYNGVPIGVANNGQGGNINGLGSNSVYFQLVQPGYQRNAPISVVVNQDGSFADLLFNGNYKLFFPTGIYPFIPADQDSVDINIQGDTKINIDIKPYYIFSKNDFSLSKTDSLVTATFDLSKIITDDNALPINNVSLYISRTSIVGDGNNALSASLAGSDIKSLSNLKLTLKVPSNLNQYGSSGAADQSNFYVRLGIKVGNIPQLLYSNVQELSF